MIYVVSGFMRSGTSMMMQCLQAGGMGLHYDPNRDVLFRRCADSAYSPNEGGYFEPGSKEFLEPDFPRQHDSKAIKILMGAIPNMSVARYRIVYMLRDPLEIANSWLRFWKTDYLPRNMERFLQRYDEYMEESIAKAKNRRDVSCVDVFQYTEVVEDPVPHFRYLKERGWPIDPEKAAVVVEPRLRRACAAAY